MAAYLFLFLAFTFLILNRLYSKHILNTVDSFTLAFLINIPGIIIFFPFVIKHQVELYNLSLPLIALIITTCVLWSYVLWAGNVAIKTSSFSIQEIIRQTRIIWVVLGGIFILGEKPSMFDVIGITVIIASVFMTALPSISIKKFSIPKVHFLTLSVAFVTGIIILFEKIIVTHVNVELYTFLAYVLTPLALSFFLNKYRLTTMYFHIRNHPAELAISSIIILIMYYCGLKAYELLPISIAYPIIQSSIVIAILIGTYLFEDKKDIVRNVLISLCVVAGILIIKFL